MIFKTNQATLRLIRHFSSSLVLALILVQTAVLAKDNKSGFLHNLFFLLQSITNLEKLV